MTIRAENDDWGTEVPNILSKENLKLLQDVLKDSPSIVEHWHYRAGCAPDRLVFDDFERFEAYMQHDTKPGDAIHIWRFDQLCRDNNMITQGKCPDKDGLRPTGGAY